MKFYKTIIKTVVVALAVMAANACQKDPAGDDGSQLNEALELAVDVEDITLTSAKIKVTHNGDKSDTWYGFLTDEVDSDEDELISQAVESYMNGDSSEGLRKSKSYVTVMKDLVPGTTYKYIAFGLSPEGKVYGSSASVEFVTKLDGTGGGNTGGGETPGNPEVDGMTLNPAWTVNYVGEGVLDDVEYDHVVTVNSTDRNTYAITVVYASLWDVNQLYDMAVMFADDLVTSVEEFNDYYGTSYTIADILYSGSRSDAFDLYPGYYMAVALGITPEGKVSGLYAVSDVFEVKEPIPTEEYKAWLGDWTIVGENDKEYTVTLSRHETNRSFWMFGWEGFEDVPVDVEYSKERNDLTFYAQLVQENYYLEKAETYVNMYFLGVDRSNMFYTATEGEYGMAIAGIFDGGQRMLVRYGVNTPNYPRFATMSYAAESAGEYYFFTDSDDLPSFSGFALINPAPSVSSLKMQSQQQKEFFSKALSLKRSLKKTAALQPEGIRANGR